MITADFTSAGLFLATAAWGVALISRRHIASTSKKYRIVSLCPSTTKTLYELGLAHCVVGRTQFCEDPPNRSIPAFGGTKNPRWNKIAALQPTHILFNLEENNYLHLPKAQAICETVVDTPVDIQGSKEMVLHLGQLFGSEDKAVALAKSMDDSLALLQQQTRERGYKFTFLYFIWHHPSQRVVGQGTYINAMLEAAGGVNLATSTISETERYPLVPENYVEKADYCFLSTEPYSYSEKYFPEYEKFGKQVKIISGEMVSWHGSGSAEGLQYLAEYFHNEE
eukprot:Nitzschia sp. Nitz4//NODE_542_length_12750_cov_80.145333//9281//10123//NITZ4_additional_000083-RA//1//CDS//3329531979//1499//frame0